MSLFGRGNKHSSEDERKAREEFWQRYNSVLGLPKVDEQAETYYNGQLIVAGAHLTQIQTEAQEIVNQAFKAAAG